VSNSISNSPSTLSRSSSSDRFAFVLGAAFLVLILAGAWLLIEVDRERRQAAEHVENWAPLTGDTPETSAAVASAVRHLTRD